MPPTRPPRRSLVTRARHELQLQHQMHEHQQQMAQQMREQLGERVRELIASRRGARPPDVVWLRLEGASRRTRREIERIVDAAIDVADAEGLDALSMRRLAKELDTGTTSIYRYVSGKDELLELMVDAVNNEDPFPDGPPADWRLAFTTIARAIRAQTLAHPWLASAMSSRPSIGPNTLRVADTILRVASQMSRDVTTAGAIVTTLLRFVRGAVVDELAEIAAEKRTGMTEAAWRDSIAPYVQSVLETGRHPSFAAVVIEGDDLTYDAQFEFGLNCLLDGFERLAAPPESTG